MNMGKHKILPLSSGTTTRSSPNGFVQFRNTQTSTKQKYQNVLRSVEIMAGAQLKRRTISSKGVDRHTSVLNIHI